MWMFVLQCAAEPVAITVPGATIAVELPPDLVGAPREALLAHVRGSAEAVAAWYGTFPAPSLRVTVAKGSRLTGSTWPGTPPEVRLVVGDAPDYADDWIVVHELTHAAFPLVRRKHHWIEEGLATYLEPWERVGAGTLSAERAWAEFARDLPQGIPADGEGLDADGSWAGTYWGGALYCFLVDLEIRERTDNRLGLRDAVRAIAKAYGGIGDGRYHELRDVLAVGDRAVGVPVLTETWRRMGARVDGVDLDAIWADLGVVRAGGAVTFRDDARRAAVRRAIAPLP